MLRLDEDALVCDLAETYGVYDWRALPVKTVATLSAGLRPDSRIMMKMSGAKVSMRDMLLMGIFDNTSLLFWSKTKDAENGRNKPKSLLASLDDKKETDIKSYTSGEEFLKDRERIIAKIRGNTDGG